MTGGLVAVHAAGRDRRAIWDAMKRREVYAHVGRADPPVVRAAERSTRGGRRWAAEASRGRGAALPGAGRGRAGAGGGLPGLRGARVSGPSGSRQLCRGECNHPEGRAAPHHAHRRGAHPSAGCGRGEPVEELIEDPWRQFACAPDPGGLRHRVRGPRFPGGVRPRGGLLRAPRCRSRRRPSTPGHLRCKYDAEGNCIEVDPCYGDYRTERGRRLPRRERGARLVLARSTSPRPPESGAGRRRRRRRRGRPGPVSRRVKMPLPSLVRRSVPSQ